MSAPIFVLGCHRSGTSAVSGLLHKACGVSMGELMPASADNPLGYFEPQGVVDAHRGLLRQLERDWTCPPSTFDPAALDLAALEEQVELQRQLPEPWAMKDPTSMFLLPAWNRLGVDKVRLVAVARPPVDSIDSIVKRDGIREDRAEAIVEAYLRRLVEIAEQVELPVIRYPGGDESVTAQVRALAASLDLPWDEAAAQEFFQDSLVRNRSTLRDTSPTYDLLLDKSARPAKVPTTDLGTLELTSEPTWPLPTHLGVHHAVQRNQLWNLATFESFRTPEVVEFILDGARPGGKRPRRLILDQLVLPAVEAAGSTLLDTGRRPHGIVAHGLLAQRPTSDIEFFLRSMHIGTHPLAELVTDVPNPEGAALLNSRPAPPDRPTPGQVEDIAAKCGWDLVKSQRVSPGREGMVFRKRVPTDHELVPMTTDLVARSHRISAIDNRIQAIESALDPGHAPVMGTGTSADRVREAERRAHVAEQRAARAEREYARLKGRRSVQMALRLADRLRPVYRAVRSWRR